VRAIKVAVAEPTAPSTGKGDVPGTSQRFAARLTMFAPHISAAAGPGRPSASSQKMRAIESR